jgi:DNA-binding beta-propeller fold protein YncE
MTFTLVDEVGIEYAPTEATRRAVGSVSLPLRYPVFAARADDGTTVIVDELGIEKSLPHRAWYRTLRLDAEGTLLSDSAQWGAGDAYGFLAGESLGILRVTQWEIELFSAAGERVETLDLSPLSKRTPIGASQTPQGTFLVAFADNVFGVDVVEVDRLGRLLWYLPRLDRLGHPGTIQLLRNGNILVADEYCHVVLELTRESSVVRQLGRWRDPGKRDNRLSSPRAAWEAADGTWVIADTRNDRVLQATPDLAVDALPEPADGLSSPTHAVLLPDRNLLVCDAGNRRVVEYDDSGEVVAQWGESTSTRRWFSFPRSVEMLPGGALLVCDTARDRVVVVDDGKATPWPVEAQTQLFWPRCARALPSGSLLVADGRNGRVLELAASGEVLRRLDRLQIDGGRPLEDPHDIHLLANGHLLITDAPSGLVVETDWDGHIFRAIGGEDAPVTLSDPHSAQLLADGSILVCDSGNHRVLWVGADGEVSSDLRALRSGSELFRFSGPRYAEISPTGVLVIADTGNNRVLAADESGELLWELSSVAGTRLPFLDQPRWAHVTTANEVLVCDHCHHRVLRLRWIPSSRSFVPAEANFKRTLRNRLGVA